jgi:hypothetical protein
MTTNNYTIVNDTSTFKRPSVFNGEVPFMTFTDNGKTIGELWGTNGKLSFTGDVDASAKIFFEHVIECNRMHLEK